MEPISTVENPAFRQFVKTLEPRYQLMCRKSLKDKLQNKYTAMKESLKKDMCAVDFVGLTHDGWTSLNTESYDTVTCSYIDKDWNMQCKVLDTLKVCGSHTAENIANCLTQVKTNWGFLSQTLVTDNAANEVKAASLINWPRLSCMGHNINLIVTAGLKEVQRLIAKGRTLVAFFHRSPLATGALLEKQKLLLSEAAQGHKLIIDCPTRWNSCLDMLERLCEQLPAITAVATDKDLDFKCNIKSKIYTFEEQTVIELLIEVLQPFKRATVLLSGEKTPTLSLVLPTIIKLECALLEKPDDPASIKKVKEAMSQNFQKRKPTVETHLTSYQLASLLDPRTKTLAFMRLQERGDIHQQLKTECIERLKLKVKFQVKKEPVEPTEDSGTLILPESNPDKSEGEALEFLLPQLPNLPSLPSVADPFESDGFDSNMNVVPVRKKLKTEIGEVNKSLHESKPSTHWLDDVVCTGSDQPQFSDEEVVCREIDSYLMESQIPSDQCPLKWWQSKVQYPHVTVLAKKYLCIPASSVSSERIFSLAGSIVNKKRTQLTPETVNMLIFLNKNCK